MLALLPRGTTGRARTRTRQRKETAKESEDEGLRGLSSGTPSSPPDDAIILGPGSFLRGRIFFSWILLTFPLVLLLACTSRYERKVLERERA